MAFCQPTHHLTQRVSRPHPDGDGGPSPPTQRSPPQKLQESQTWVLFSPVTASPTVSSLGETEPFPHTTGRSRISDLGSLGTEARWDRHDETTASGSLSILEHDSAADDAELDSLDDHLPDFRSLPGAPPAIQQESHQATTVLPSHDGLGSFRLGLPALGADAQNQIYQFERFNPRRIHRRQETLDPARLEVEREQDQSREKRQWIEAWRLEQSRAILDEIQRQTYRRRRSQASLHRAPVPSADAGRVSRHHDADSDDETWHDEDAMERSEYSGGFISRLTRSVVRDLLGLDDKMLSMLFGGEGLPDEDDLSSTPKATQGGLVRACDAALWQMKVVERVSRELGWLINHVPHHPGAFSTFSRMPQMPLPYAGLPVIPETSSTTAVTDASTTTRERIQTTTPEFQPTMAHRKAQPMAIPGREREPAPSWEAEPNVMAMANTFTKEEWEADIDIKLVFRYLRSRFLSRSTNTTTPSGSHTHPAPAGPPQDAVGKAARVRHHHPLISRSRPPLERRAFKVAAPGSPVGLRHASSCASQSTRRSVRRSSCSSRHYWDIGGSLGTGSMVASNGPMGSWGEV